MDLMKRLCPHSPYVWNSDGVSECFSNLVLGFGANILTVVLVAAIGASKRSARDGKRVPLLLKVSLHLIPALGASMALYDMIVLIKKMLDSNHVQYHEWLFRFSQFSVWATILLVLKCGYCYIVCCNPILCVWWMLKFLLLVPHLQRDFTSLQVLLCLKESFTALMDMCFGVSINIIRATARPQSSSCVEEELLLPSKMDSGQGSSRGVSKGIICNCWDLIAFKSIKPVMECGVKRQLNFEDLLELPIDMDPSSCHTLLLTCWKAQQRNEHSHPSLIKTICRAYGWQYFRLGLLKVLNDCLGFAGPLLLNKLIRFLQQGSRDYDGYILALSLGLSSVLKSFLDTQYTFHLSKLKLKLRSSIMSLIYGKCLSVSLAERSKFSEGEIQTFMSVDADRIANLCNSLHDVWSLPLQIGIALYLLYTQVKFAFLSGIAIIILLIPVNKWIANVIAKATQSMMEQKDERIRMTSEILTHIRTLKMYGWELLFASWLMKTRSEEVKHLSTRKYLDSWCVFFWATTPTLFSLFTFGLYTLMGHQLDAATVFTCVALFNNLISPLNSFPWVINGLIDAVISSRRLCKYLSCFEQETNMEEPNNCSIFSCSNKQNKLQDMAVVTHDASCTWSSSDQNEIDLVLDPVNLLIPKGLLVAVVGEVGSGKSSLLNLILGETRLINGSVDRNGSIAYVPQVAWILSGTVRDNILFGREYDPRRYSEVLRACSLDFDISRMTGGDMAFVGEKGFNLSGGQRARLALARAVYHDKEIYLLDDILSAVDAHVGCSILHNAILGPPMNQQTRILCTHNIQAISAADLVIMMDKGHVKWVGNPIEFSCPSDVAFSTIDELSSCSEVQQQDKRSNISSEIQQKISEGDFICTPDGNQVTDESEARNEGKVEVIVYKSYAAFAGWFITVLTCLSAVFMQASRNGNDMWLSYWVDASGRNQKAYSTTFYLAVLSLFCLANSLLTLVRAFSFAFGGLRAAVKVHDRLLQNLMSAPISFFDLNPSGRIINRLSSDLYTIDDSLPFILNILVANFVGLLGIAIVLSYVQVTFLLLLMPFWYIYRKLQLYYRSTSRELRRLDSVSRSPIYASFTETLDGSSTIRGFNCEDLFLLKFNQHLMIYQRTSYSEVTASLWLSLRLQLLAAFIVSFIAVMAVIGSHEYLPINLGTPGLVGLALSYAAPIVSLLGSFLTSFTETEKEMVSVERILQYMDVPREEDVGGYLLHPQWPHQGDISFVNVTLKYKPQLPPALCGVSFAIAGGTQVGIIGRTGAGKSSILNALFRLYPTCGGSIMVDGVNIVSVSVRYLRSSFAVVPQAPFLFEGSIRKNLDPLQEYRDFEIWSVLEKCHIKEEVEAAGGLDVQLKGSGTAFSVGQKQLLCLARALLKSCKVLCLDECTANVDTETTSKLQKTLATECQGTTVITIAHRISTVMNMDNILILDRGFLVEQGNPRVLVEDQSSIFFSFANASKM
ncbi:ABC transporter C family member 13 isoform X1 [Lycium barbarum]|uniref:ABC transporter C family member 13 isoform X1 n=1 Tax=Lycium barbarum TaxID=112863 RepID=UPI00293EEA8B|nr:ABC transporter C family member 13 isoform X1 [Lycium barbarum]